MPRECHLGLLLGCVHTNGLANRVLVSCCLHSYAQLAVEVMEAFGEYRLPIILAQLSSQLQACSAPNDPLIFAQSGCDVLLRVAGRETEMFRSLFSATAAAPYPDTRPPPTPTHHGTSPAHAGGDAGMDEGLHYAARTGRSQALGGLQQDLALEYTGLLRPVLLHAELDTLCDLCFWLRNDVLSAHATQGACDEQLQPLFDELAQLQGDAEVRCAFRASLAVEVSVGAHATLHTSHSFVALHAA